MRRALRLVSGKVLPHRRTITTVTQSQQIRSTFVVPETQLSQETLTSQSRHICSSTCGHIQHRCTTTAVRSLSTGTVKNPSVSRTGNRGVVYAGPGHVEVQDIPFPTFQSPVNGKEIHHGVILKVVASNICGSDQHMVRSRTSAPTGLILGHEITGIIIETGRDVEFFQKGDLVSVPFNIACGRCQNCKDGKTHICLTTNAGREGAAYGYVDMGGWVGGQAEYVMVPYADFQLLNLGAMTSKEAAMAKIKDLAMLTDIFPTGFHGAVSAGVHVGSTVYVAGAGPVGLAAAASCQLLGAAAVVVGDMIPSRLEAARSFGCFTLDLSKLNDQSEIPSALKKMIGSHEVDHAIDCVGFEARGCGHAHHQVEQPASVLNTCMAITRAGGGIGIPGLYVTSDPGAVDTAAKQGSLSLRLGLGWAKSLTFATGQTPVMHYHRRLYKAIMFDKIHIAKAVNAQVISLDNAPAAYDEFDKGAAKKFIIDPHNLTRQM